MISARFIPITWILWMNLLKFVTKCLKKSTKDSWALESLLTSHSMIDDQTSHCHTLTQTKEELFNSINSSTQVHHSKPCSVNTLYVFHAKFVFIYFKGPHYILFSWISFNAQTAFVLKCRISEENSFQSCSAVEKIIKLNISVQY